MKTKSNISLLMMIILIGCLGQIGSDIYAPSLPAISHALHTPINWVQWTMSIYLISIGITQLFYGPISEMIGRRKPLIFGMILLLIGSYICFTAQNITTLMIGRCIQGVGAGSCSLWRAIFRDSFSGTLLAKYGTYMTVGVILIVPAAPALGGYLQQYIDWHASFAFIMIYAAIVIAIIYRSLKETSVHHSNERKTWSFVGKSYQILITSRLFMGYGLAVFLSYGAFFAWFVVGPVLLIHHLHMLPVTFGWITFLTSAGAMSLGAVVNTKLVDQLGTRMMLRIGWGIMFTAGLLMLLGYWFLPMNVLTLVVPITILYFGATLIWPNAFAGGFSPFGHIAGFASAIYSSLQMSGAAVQGAILAHLPDQNQLPIALIMLISPFCAWLIFEWMVVPASKKSQAN